MSQLVVSPGKLPTVNSAEGDELAPTFRRLDGRHRANARTLARQLSVIDSWGAIRRLYLWPPEDGAGPEALLGIPPDAPDGARTFEGPPRSADSNP